MAVKKLQRYGLENHKTKQQKLVKTYSLIQ